MLDMQDFSRPIVERWVRQGSEPGRTILRNVLIAMDRKKAKANKKWWQFWIQRAR